MAMDSYSQGGHCVTLSLATSVSCSCFGDSWACVGLFGFGGDPGDSGESLSWVGC